jgi:alanine dehydrogenase
MKNIIGIRYEDKYKMERRVALTPKHIKELRDKTDIEFQVQTSKKRVFTDAEFEEAGAQIVQELSEPNVIMGVKEMPNSFFEKDKTYIFFSHVIKGQSYNMPMLKKMMEMKANLIDYEKVADDEGHRLIFFGRFAGLAGMINSLWSLGQRLEGKGIKNPFIDIKQSHHYSSLEEAKAEVRRVGELIKKEGLPKEITPLTIGFTGYGNVSKGAIEIAELMPVEEVSPQELMQLKNSGNYSDKVVYKTIFKEEDISRLKDNSNEFVLQDYYDHPEKYENQFDQYVPHLSVLMNCMYWDDKYPRIVTSDLVKELQENNNLRLEVVGDVTCDPDGSIEFMHKGTPIEDPVFVYNPISRKANDGFEGDGILVMAVDILPSELPRESSETFSDALFPYMEAIANADFMAEYDKIDIPSPIKGAMILCHGELTPDYRYIEKYL